MAILTLPFILYTYLFFINVVAFALYGLDKHRAVYGEWRIPEAVLLGLSIIGGAYGAAAGMLFFNHKTRHTAFLITVPLTFLLWIALLVILCLYA